MKKGLLQKHRVSSRQNGVRNEEATTKTAISSRVSYIFGARNEETTTAVIECALLSMAVREE